MQTYTQARARPRAGEGQEREDPAGEGKRRVGEDAKRTGSTDQISHAGEARLERTGEVMKRGHDAVFQACMNAGARMYTAHTCIYVNIHSCV